ncbi:Short chain dehydrogenase sol3 [Psilocybe cubensis]|uniref:NAD(P)-binding protein n=2 Tax=Psilocybe cubensis TaxID=181762 RepID=A0A8H7XS04_PSICU|nr:Short chain dehydrogenase sol3 [Psilocybe cubensis]KAH9479748.1 Short chain dehydrogenase sol3 [Psilocybe cubensis]
MQLTIGQFISQQRSPVAPVIVRDLRGKTIIVTGANIGIGLETAKHFARMKPARLILACRSKERGDAAVEQIKKETGCENVELWILNLGEFASVKAFAERFEKEGGGRLDILVENAAILPSAKFETTPDGWETSFQVNYLATSLLALLLLPTMVQTAKEYDVTPRIVVVSSEVHYWAKIDPAILEAPNPLKAYGGLDNFTSKTQGNRYAETKLLNILFTRALNDRLNLDSTNDEASKEVLPDLTTDEPPASIIVNAVNPGYCYSNLRSTYTGPRAWFDWFMERVLARTAEEGSRQVVWAALGCDESENAAGGGSARQRTREREAKMKGAYISNASISEPSDYVIGEEGRKAQDLLWDNLLEELTKVDPEVEKIAKEYLTPPPKKQLDPLPESVFQGI